MKSKSLFLLFAFTLFCSSAKVAAQVIDDFESETSSWLDVDAWQGVSINPYKSNLNNSNFVLGIVRANTAAKFWAGALRNISSSPTGRYLHVKMFRNNTHRPKLKLSDTQPIELSPIAGTVIREYEWQDIVFDMQAVSQRQFILIMVDETAEQLDNDAIVYIDDIEVNDSSTPRTAVDPADNNKPVMGNASLVSTGFNEAVMDLTATDTDGNGSAAPVFAYIVNDAANNLTDREVRINGLSKFVLTDLPDGKTFNITIRAKDRAGNLSDNTASLSFSTDKLEESLVIDDFESGENRGWIAAEQAHAVWIIDNPVPSSVNNSSKVMQTGRDHTANSWAAPLRDKLNIKGGVYRYMHIMTYRNIVSPTGIVNLKVSDVAPPVEMLPSAGLPLKINEWQDLVFDLSAINGKSIDFIYFMMDRGTLTAPLVIYIDNIELNNNPAPRTTTGLSRTEITDYNISSSKGVVEINALVGQDVSLYSLDGRCLSVRKNCTGNVQIHAHKGIFLIKVDDRMHKVIVQ